MQKLRKSAALLGEGEGGMMRFLPLAIAGLGASVGVLSPLVAYGDARIGPGGGDLLNGNVALTLMMLGALLAVRMLQRKRAEGGDR